MKVDIKQVDKIVHDYSNKKIEIFTKEGYSMWSNIYQNEKNFNKVLSAISKEFSKELQRRAVSSATN